MNKKQLIKVLGGTEAEAARRMGMSQQRVNQWNKTVSNQQMDGIIGVMVRGAKVRPDCIPIEIWESLHG